MVRLRPNPLGPEIGQAFRQNLNSNPFTLRYYQWKKYQFFDHALKNPRACMAMAGTLALLGALAYNLVIYNTRWGQRQPVFFASVERPWTYVHFERDTRKPRGEYNNNFMCWSGNPDCGKDFKPKYFA